MDRYLPRRERLLAKMLGEIANMRPEVWARVQKSFDEASKPYYEANSYNRIMT